MREILFRSKRTDNGEWIEGYVYRISEKLNPFIMLKNICTTWAKALVGHLFGISSHSRNSRTVHRNE